MMKKITGEKNISIVILPLLLFSIIGKKRVSLIIIIAFERSGTSTFKFRGK